MAPADFLQNTTNQLKVVTVVIHTDFECGFIRGKISMLHDCQTYNSKAARHEVGKMAIEVRDKYCITRIKFT